MFIITLLIKDVKNTKKKSKYSLTDRKTEYGIFLQWSIWPQKLIKYQFMLQH